MPRQRPAWTGAHRPRKGTLDILTSRTILHPADLDRSLAFYGDALDLAVAREFGRGTWPRRGLLRRRAGSSRWWAPSRPAHADPARGGAVAAGPVDRGRRRRARSRGDPWPARPRLEPWGLIEAWIDDPDGLRIHLVEVPVDHPLRRDLRPVPAPAPARCVITGVPPSAWSRIDHVQLAMPPGPEDRAADFYEGTPRASPGCPSRPSWPSGAAAGSSGAG